MALRVGMDGKFLPLQGKKLRQILPAVCIPQIFQDEPERVHNLSTQDKHRVSWAALQSYAATAAAAAL